MSAEDKEKIVTGVLGRDPAYLYTVKSASMGNIENLWEDAFARKKGKDDAGIASTREYEAKSSSKCKTKKNRLAWTNELHHKFLEAIEHLGIARASPTRILEFMNTPGVTKHHIASHLQRHRRSLKRIQEGISFLFPEQQHSPPSGTISMPPLASARFLSSQAPICTISDCRNSTGGMKLQHEIPFPISNSSAAGNYVGFIMGSNGYEIKRNSYENTYGGTITEYVSASAGSSLHQQRQVSVTPLKHKLHCFEIDEEFDLLLDEIASSAPEFLMDGDFDDIFLN
ncbi:transcription factor BOA-like [Malania oleifera]|uniref:transcription factor BOA-like n=1 Tax=Malania oleifera TaxID=397392 RepID=UPI0025AE841C|nr:transcription factor BOA-like [Malania oleifera]